MKLVLASASPRRRELMEKMGITDFSVTSAKGEEPDYSGLPPRKRVEKIALYKAECCRSDDADTVVIAADTLVFVDDTALGKPSSPEDAARMLRMLSGRSHYVATGVALIRGDKILVDSELTEVRFCELSDEEISAYIATGEPMDKAGAYGIQGRGCILIEGINGDYYNVMGLPVRKLYEMLRVIGG